MFRRAISANVPRALSTLTRSNRAYTNYDHIKYPIYPKAVVSIVAYFVVMWFVLIRQGSLLTSTSAYKEDYLRVWRRKLGTGYQWADAWGPQIDTVFKNLPDSVE